MKHLILARFGSVPGKGTFGKLWVAGGGFNCVTVEREWKDNEPFVSCVPAGIYRLVKTVHRGKYPAYQLVNVPDRSAINIHIANAQHELAGCIALGSWFGGSIENNWAIVYSRQTYAKFMHMMDNTDDAKITILWKRPEVGPPIDTIDTIAAGAW